MIVMRRWREDTRARLRLGAALPAPSATTLIQDVRTYLAQVATMPSLRDRSDDLARWIRVFGPDRDRATITAGEIRTQLEAWRAAGYAANTCNHRRTALMSLFTVLDGKNAPNPVKDVPRYRDESLDAPPRALSPAAADLLLAMMPPSKARARLCLLRWTGWPPAQIARLTPADIRWNEAVYVRPRRKGKGAAGAWLPLLPAAWDALRDFVAANAWKQWRSSGRPDLRRAAAKIRATIMLPLDLWHELENVTPYQLRHSFLTLVAAASRDDRAVMALGQHGDIRTSHRYTKAATDPRVQAAIQAVERALDGRNRAASVPADHDGADSGQK